MDRGGRRSGESPGVLIKKRSSSGCLIVKKNDGVGRICSFSESRPNWESNKRSRMITSDSESSDRFTIPRNMRQYRNVEESRFGWKRDCVEGKGDDCFVGNSREWKESKRHRLDDDDDNDDDEESEDELMAMRMRRSFDGSGVDIGKKAYLGSAHFANDREYGTGSSRKGLDIEKRRKPYLDGSGNIGFGNQGYRNRCKVSGNEAKTTHALLLQKKYKRDMNFDEPIRVQGKNGVLKVMVNKQNKIGGLLQNAKAEQTQCGSTIQETGKIRVAIQLPNTLKTEKLPKLPPPARIQSNGLKLPMSLTMKSKGQNQDSEDSDSSGRLQKRIIQPHKPSQMSSTGGEKTLPEASMPSKIRDGKIRRGSGTEKQRLRERIREMLLEAGWTIDYRPRRNRDYLDAVYISPRGTAYWSIIKAYEALLKQLNSGEKVAKPCDDSSTFSLISDEILSQLTRKTKSKIEKDMKRELHSASDSDGKATFARNFLAIKNEVGNDDRYVHKQQRNVMSVKNEVNSRDSSQGTTSKSESPLHHQTEKSTGSSSHRVDGGKSSKHGRSTLLVRRSVRGDNSESDGFVPSSEKRTVLAWLIDSGTLQLSEKVMYMNQRRTRAMLEGWITRDGIHCGCCSKILAVSKFEIHAGSKLRQPFQNIFLNSGVSLLQCQIDAWDKQKGAGNIGFCSVDVIADDPNDDACGICGDGGDLVCCDGCPSTFHQRCLDIRMFPLGDWHCPNCTCKFCKAVIEDVTQTVGANTCKMCEKKYHKSCMPKANVTPADTTEPITSFCGKKCKALSEGVKKYVGVKHELEAGFSWSLVHRECTNSDLSLSGHPHIVENNSKLALALTVMDECFLPIIDRRSGVNIVQNVLYNCGSNFNRLNFGGFYTALLERGDEIVASASIRFHGNRLAEMPFIGTRHVYRHQGMCRRLFSVVESALQHLKVKLLIIPATADFSHVWISKFGFRQVEDSLKKEMRSMNLLTFPGIDVLQKELLAPRHTESAVDTEDCDPCNEGTNSAIKTNEVSVLETTSPSRDKLVSDYLVEHQPYEDVSSASRDSLVHDGYPKMLETAFKTSTMARSSDMEKHMDCKTSYSRFDGEDEEDSLIESPPQRNSDMAFLDHIIRSPVDTGATENRDVYGSGDDDSPETQ
ncbi:Zinc finger PHD-finger [Arabidopsis thaliana x Arabidopsis arenosa]|uniref:Zinc finger PHD-finger n=1 Tax=Arabidopsis thaliana x Arabidopsis arenosa TaxID=1240361 RepID=A0A8T2DYS8_9BRAS|nr:Zinc finger PHD-finger [Arabidopsis thaliana x Arabidopsis arenosa]